MVLGLDPGYRNGCKLAVVAEDGSLLECSVVYPNPPQQQTGPAAETLLRLAARYNVLSFAVGNGQVGKPRPCLCLWQQALLFSELSLQASALSVWPGY